MVLVDTNVVAHLLLAGEPGIAARALYEADPDWRSEPLLFFELTNVLATSVRRGDTSLAKAVEALDTGKLFLSTDVMNLPRDYKRATHWPEKDFMPGDHLLFVHVEDTGPGIPREN